MNKKNKKAILLTIHIIGLSSFLGIICIAMWDKFFSSKNYILDYYLTLIIGSIFFMYFAYLLIYINSYNYHRYFKKQRPFFRFADEAEQKQYISEISADKKGIEDAIKRKDCEYLFEVFKKYSEKYYLEDVLKLQDKILKLDATGEYKRKIDEFYKNSEQQGNKNDYGKFIGKDALLNIEKLEEKYIKDLSPQNILALADAYRKYAMYTNALIYYKSLLEKFPKSSEANVAEMRIKELEHN